MYLSPIRFTLIRKELNFFFYFTANKSQRISKFIETMYLLISDFKHLCIVYDASCIAREMHVVQITRVSKRSSTHNSAGLHAETSYSYSANILPVLIIIVSYISHMHVPTNCCVYSIIEKNDVLHPSIVPALKLKLP